VLSVVGRELAPLSSATRTGDERDGRGRVDDWDLVFVQGQCFSFWELVVGGGQTMMLWTLFLQSRTTARSFLGQLAVVTSLFFYGSPFLSVTS